MTGPNVSGAKRVRSDSSAASAARCCSGVSNGRGAG